LAEKVFMFFSPSGKQVPGGKKRPCRPLNPSGARVLAAAPAKGAKFYSTTCRIANLAGNFRVLAETGGSKTIRIFFNYLRCPNVAGAGHHGAIGNGTESVGIIPPMENRQLTPVDRLLSGLDHALRTVSSAPTRATRPNPAAGIDESELTDAERSHAAGLMRVNHAGEIAAQGLYQGHAAVARDPAIEAQMSEAAREELDHLAWCESRLTELGATPSALRPLWYAGSFVIGAASGILGDKWSLGFIEETERQVSDHLGDHLEGLPVNDLRSRAIVAQMRDEEEVHGANAANAGAAPLPGPVRETMRRVASVMKGIAYRI
jgi:ubiquinone biosynthesis monooxygenase Coq7